MKTLVACFTSCALIFVLCLAAQSADQTKWSQPVDTTSALFGEESQVSPPPSPTPGIWDNRAADDWKCLDGTPITTVKWWGDYHRWLDTETGPVDPPTLQPTSFFLRQYSNDATDPSNTKPGTLLNEVEIPLAKCNQAFFQTVSTGVFGHIHIFSYAVTLDTPWTQTQDSIYWLSIQAKFATNPWDQPEPKPFMNWDWLSTPPGDFLGTGLSSSDAGVTWSNPFSPEKFNLAFELLPATFSPFNLKLGNAVLSTSGTLVLSADITVKGTSSAGVQCLPYVAVTAGGVQNFVLSGNKVTTKMTPYLTNGKARYFTLSEDILNLPIASIAYTGLAKGQYPVQAALLDSRGAVMGQIAERTLTIE